MYDFRSQELYYSFDYLLSIILDSTLEYIKLLLRLENKYGFQSNSSNIEKTNDEVNQS